MKGRGNENISYSTLAWANHDIQPPPQENQNQNQNQFQDKKILLVAKKLYSDRVQQFTETQTSSLALTV